MQALRLPARAGWNWLAGGFAIFRKNPPMLTMLVVSYWLLVATLSLVPFIGVVAATLCTPAFSVSLMNACRDLDQGRLLTPRVLISGFSENLRVLLMLGALYLGATITILGVSALADGGLLMELMLDGKAPAEEAKDGAPFFAALILALLLLTPLLMAYWYAPALAAWHGFSQGKALFFSFAACLRNWRAFVAYLLSILFFAGLVPNVLLALLTALMPKAGGFFVALFTVPLLLVLAPTLFASFYVSYRDVFVSVDENV